MLCLASATMGLGFSTVSLLLGVPGAELLRRDLEIQRPYVKYTKMDTILVF